MSFDQDLGRMMRAMCGRRTETATTPTFAIPVVTYASAEHVLEQRRKSETGCILLDVRMPGLEWNRRFTAAWFELDPVSDYVGVRAALKADDFLIKPIKSDELLRAIERALARHQFDALEGRLATLTARELQVFVFTVRGKTKKQAAMSWARPQGDGENEGWKPG